MITHVYRRGLLLAASALSLMAVVGCSRSTPDEGQRLAALEARLDGLSANVERVEAVRSIRRVQQSYGHYSELGLWHDLADLFADEAVGNYPAGVLIGKEKIRELFLKDVGGGIVGLAEGRIYPHIVLSPVVTLDEQGTSAKGRWRILAMLGGYGRSASWAGGSYENQYVKEGGRWKISNLSFLSQYGGRYKEGLKPSPSGPPHFTAAQAGAAIPLSGAPSPVSGVGDLAALAPRLIDLEARAQHLVDEGEVANLQHLHDYLFDGKQWDELVDLLAEDASFEHGQRGVYLGRERIRRALGVLFGESRGEGEVHDHVQMQTLVTVAPDGLSARARSTQIGMSGERGGRAQWTQGISENEFVKVGDTWRIRSIRFYPRLITDYREGWATSALPAPGPSTAFPPDRPPTEVYQTYPGFHIPAFHFPHPVTGRPAQYPDGMKVESPAPQQTQSAARLPQPTTIEELGERLAKAENAIANAAAYDSAKNVVNAYGYFLDERMWAEVGNLFASDGENELAGVGVYVGPRRVSESLDALYGPSSSSPETLSVHKQAQPVIAVAPDGRSARVRSRLFQIDVSAREDDALSVGEYDFLLVQEEGAWRIKSAGVDYAWRAAYSRGWSDAAAATASPAEVQARDRVRAAMPPDRSL